MTNFFQRLENRVQAINSLLCVGLDPHPEDLQNGKSVQEFCLNLIEATREYAAAYKPNAAFFEALGASGWEALKQVIEAIPEEIPVLLDAKRGDISSTAFAYAQSTFSNLGADAVTINPYLGYDAIAPFIQKPETGIFLLCKTSNPGARDLQDLTLGSIYSGKKLFEHVARLAQEWNHNSNIGLVVGATQTEALARVRAEAPDLWILAPGVGAQGGDLAAALQAGLRADGMGLLIPVSRGISRAQDPQKAAQEIRDEINLNREKIQGKPSQVNVNPLADALLDIGCVRFGSFTLKSGLQSPIYLDLRRLAAHPEVLAQVAAAYFPILKNLSFNHLAALPYAALPIATAISLLGNWSMIYPRKEIKAYGTKAQIEGVFERGEKAVVIDDLITTGESKFEGINKLTNAGLKISDVVVLIDRQSGGAAAMTQQGFKLHSVFTLRELLNYWEGKGQVSREKVLEIKRFLGKT